MAYLLRQCISLNRQQLLLVGRVVIGCFSLSLTSLVSPLQAQVVTSTPNAASAQSNAAANSSGSTVNQQVNNQLNQSSSYGLGVGINCPVPTLGLAFFGASGSGNTSGYNPLGGVDAQNIGAAANLTMPIADGELHDSCEQIGKYQSQLLQTQISELESRTERNRIEAYKVRMDVELVVLLKCVELKRNAQLLNDYARMCADIIPVGQVPQPPIPPKKIDPPANPTGPSQINTSEQSSGSRLEKYKYTSSWVIPQEFLSPSP